MCCQNFFSPAMFITGSGGPSAPIDCTGIVISSYAPTCYTPTSSNLCGFLAGINNAICALQNTPTSCADIELTGTYPCFGLTCGLTPCNLCQALTAINNTFCSLAIAHPTIPIPVGFVPIIDGNKGTLSGAGTLTGMIASSNITMTGDDTIVHGNSANSLRATSSSTATGSVSTSTPFSVAAGQLHTMRVFLYTVSGEYPSGAVVSLIVNGTGTQIPVHTLTLGSGNVGRWSTVYTEYTPDVNQTVTITIEVTGFTSGTYINFADLIFEVLTVPNGGPNFELGLAQQLNIENLYGSIGNSFVVTGAGQTNTGLVATIAQAAYNVIGNIVYSNAANVTLGATLDNYVYYDTWTSSYTVKSVTISDSQPLTDGTAIVLWKFTTNGSAVTSATDLRITTPFVGTSIAAGTITGTQIASNTVADANMTLTAVTPGTYIGSVTVNSTGRITAAANVFSFTTPLNNAVLQYDATSSLWINSQALNIDAGTTSLASGQVNSPYLSLTGYYYSGTPSAPGSVSAQLIHKVTSNAPFSTLIGYITGISPVQVLSVDSNRNFSVLNTLSAPGSPLTGGYYEYSANVTINTVTKAAPHFMDAFGNIIILTTTNAYTTGYATFATSISAYTTAATSSYTGIASGVGGSPYAKVADLNTLEAAYENLRASYDNLLAVVNQMVADFTTLGFFS